MGRIKVVAAVIMAVALLAGALYFLDFVVGQSEATTEAAVYASSNQGAGEMLRAQPGRNLTIFVNAKDPLAGALGRELQKNLSQSGLFAEVVFEPKPGVSADGHAIRVNVESVDARWSGVYSRAKVKATIAFSSEGDVSWIGQQTHEFSTGDPAIMIGGTYTMEDTTRGLVSHAGYRSQLGRSLAGEIAKSLTNELNRLAQPAM